jgi:hypothetical protein
MKAPAQIENRLYQMQQAYSCLKTPARYEIHDCLLWCEPPKDSHQAWESKGSSPCHSCSLNFICSTLQLAVRMCRSRLILGCSETKKACSGAPGWKAKPFIFSLYIYHLTCLFTSRLAMAECIGARFQAGRHIAKPSHHWLCKALRRRSPYFFVAKT